MTRLLALVAARQGVGATTLAANLAATLAAETEAAVLALDLDPASHGDLAHRLGATAAPGLDELLTAADDEALRRRIPAHPRVKVGALRGPGDLGRALPRLGALAPWLVADVGTDSASPALAAAGRILVVTTPDPLVAAATARLLETLARADHPAEVVHVLVSRAAEAEDAARVSRALGRRVLARLVEEREVSASAARSGLPVVVESPSGAFAGQVRGLVRAMRDRGLLEAPARPLAVDPEALPPTDDTRALRRRLHERLVETAERRADGEGLRERVEAALRAAIDAEAPALVDREARRRLVAEVAEEALGTGPIAPFLADPTVTEVLVNGPDQVYVERGGRLVREPVAFTDERRLVGVIERIVGRVGRRIDERSPMVDARLPDGSRVNAVIAPVALDGPLLTIRRFRDRPFTVEELIASGSLPRVVAEWMAEAVRGHQNLLVSGGTGTGKTTLLNVLAGFIPADERIVTVEDAAELRLPQPHVVRLESRPPNLEGQGQITIRDLVRNALRMRPNRIVVGECRGAEALDMLQAMNTGHDGSLTTLHANTPEDALARLETLVMFAGLDLPSRAIREQIGRAIHGIVQIARAGDGRRRVVAVCAVDGMDGERVRLRPVWAEGGR